MIVSNSLLVKFPQIKFENDKYRIGEALDFQRLEKKFKKLEKDFYYKQIFSSFLKLKLIYWEALGLLTYLYDLLAYHFQVNKYFNNKEVSSFRWNWKNILDVKIW